MNFFELYTDDYLGLKARHYHIKDGKFTNDIEGEYLDYSVYWGWEVFGGTAEKVDRILLRKGQEHAISTIRRRDRSPFKNQLNVICHIFIITLVILIFAVLSAHNSINEGIIKCRKLFRRLSTR